MKQLVKFNARTGSYLDSIQVQFSDGVESIYSPRYGGSGGGDHDWNVPKGQYVKQV